MLLVTKVLALAAGTKERSLKLFLGVQVLYSVISLSVWLLGVNLDSEAYGMIWTIITCLAMVAGGIYVCESILGYRRYIILSSILPLYMFFSRLPIHDFRTWLPIGDGAIKAILGIALWTSTYLPVRRILGTFWILFSAFQFGYTHYLASNHELWWRLNSFVPQCLGITAYSLIAWSLYGTRSSTPIIDV